MTYLVQYLRDAFSFVLKEMGYEQFGEEELAKGIDGNSFMDRIDKQIKQPENAGFMVPKAGRELSGFVCLVVNDLTAMYNKRQLEYGALKKESWFGDVALRFGKRAGEALGGDEGAVVFHCAILAPDIFQVLLLDLVNLADIDI